MIRVVLAAVGVVAMVWGATVLPQYRSAGLLIDVAKAVMAGEAFKPEILANADLISERSNGASLRSAVMRSAVIIRLRRAEEAMRDGNSKIIDERVLSASSLIDQALLSAPDDSFLWLARFWVANVRRSADRRDLFRNLRMSYQLGRHEGWVGAK